MSFIKDYFALTKQYIDEYGENTILLMQCGAFFEVYGLKDKNETIYGSNICDFSRICDLNVVDKKVCVGNDGVVMSGFKDHLVDKYIKKLQDTGYTVAVYAQNDEPVAGQITRSLLGVFSPGTYFSVDTETITNKTCCIWIQTQKKGLHSLLKSANTCSHIVYVGVALIDIYTGTSCIMEYSEQYIKNPTTFDELERFISVHCPSETIIISNLCKNDIDDIVSYINIKSKAVHFVSIQDFGLDNNSNNKNIIRALNCEKQMYQAELLTKFYKFYDIGAFMTIFGETVYATQAFCYLLDFIYQHNPNLVYKIAEPIVENNCNKLVLANHSLKQLNIIDDDTYRGKYSSVVKMLNECITPMGKRKFAHSFLNPVTDIKYLETEYNIIESLLANLSKNNSDEYAVVKQMMSSFKDLTKINRQIMLKKIQPKYLYQLYTGIEMSKMIYNFVINNNDLTEYLHKKLGSNVFQNLLVYIVEISTFLDNKLIMNLCKDIDSIHKIEQSFIKNGVDKVLDNKIMTLMESEDQLECCRAYFSSIIANYETGGKKKVSKKATNNITYNINELDTSSSDNSFVKIHETEKNNFSLIATDRRCKILEEVLSLNKEKSVVLTYKSSFYKDERQFILDIGKDNITFEKQSASNRFITSPQINKMCKDVSSIKINLIDTVAKVYNNIVNELECFQDKIEDICNFITYVDLVYAKTYVAFKYNYCKPVISKLNDKSYVKAQNLRHCLIEKIQQSELYVANDITIGTNDTDGILLYGTNAVGKTSIIRALGIAVVMAQSGLYVPASSFIYCPYKYIFTRILGNDNLFKGLSTFAVEMSELRTILRLADNNSLVLGDELCSGTESTSAISIFVAGVQTLYKKGCSFIFATHLHEIVNYDEITSLSSVKCKHLSVIYDKELDALVYDRKLKDGPGNNMYGLEVCKSLSLPQDFLELAYNIRLKYKPEANSVLDRKKSHFNAKHIKGQCDNCGKNMATEVHHLQYQQDSDERGLISNEKDGLTFHKNHPANLLSLCEECHNQIHEKGTRLKKVKTSKGTIIKEL